MVKPDEQGSVVVAFVKNRLPSIDAVPADTRVNRSDVGHWSRAWDVR